MFNVNLRKIGGAVMLAVPPAILDSMKLQAGSTVTLAVDGGRLIIERHAAPRYGLDELLAQCDGSVSITEEDQTWLDASAAGNELL